MLSALLDPLEDPRWAELVARAPAASIFHHPAWLGLLRRRYGYPIAGAAVLDAGGRPLAGLPIALVSSPLTGRRLVALPFSDSCPPLLAPGAPAAALDRLAEVVERERRARDVPVQVRAPFPQLGAVSRATSSTSSTSRAGKRRSRRATPAGSAGTCARRSARACGWSSAPTSPRSTPSTRCTCGRGAGSGSRRGWGADERPLEYTFAGGRPLAASHASGAPRAS